MPEVVTCLLEDKGKILILKRSLKVRTYKGLWGGVAGYVEEGETPLETAIKEIKEEVSLEKDEVKLVRRISPVKFTDFYEGEKYDWTIFPFLFSVDKKDKIKIDWEHSEIKWIIPSKIINYDTVPHLKEIVLKFFS